MTDNFAYWLHNHDVFAAYINSQILLEEGDKDDKIMARKYLLRTEHRYIDYLESEVESKDKMITAAAIIIIILLILIVIQAIN